MSTDFVTAPDATERPAVDHAAFSFHDELVALLPRLRVQALSLTRHRAEAEDLVQATVANALAAQASFTPGTHFGAWMHRILRNRFISDRRRRRETVDLDDAPAEAFARSGNQEDSIALGELRQAMGRLPNDQRIALVMVAVQGMSYEDVAASTGCAVGTAKCRVFRARRTLEAQLLSDHAPGEKARGRRQDAGTTSRSPRMPNTTGKERPGAAITGYDGSA